MRKRVLCHMRTTKAQKDSRLGSVAKTLARFCGCAGRFESDLVGNSRSHVLSCRGSFQKKLGD